MPKCTHGYTPVDRIQRSHTFICVMPIVASCWQNEFPRNLFYAEKRVTTIHITQHNARSNSFVLSLLLSFLFCTIAHTHTHIWLPSPNFWFIISDHYRTFCFDCAFWNLQNYYEIGHIKLWLITARLLHVYIYAYMPVNVLRYSQ